MMYNSVFLEAAGQHLGLEEWAGAKDNPVIVGFFQATGNDWVKDDETPWCAAFVGAVMAQVGVPGTGKLNARSYLDWGRKVSMRDAMPGDVAVFYRGNPKGWQGHVAFVVRLEGDKILVRGGNQGNAVTDQWYPISRLLGLRRWDGARATPERPVLKLGVQGRSAIVMDLQSTLKSLRYFSGKLDGDFGPLTEAAVMALQADHGLVRDGIVGEATWAVLANANPRPTRDVSTDDLRKAGSETIKGADGAQVITVLTTGGAGLAVAVEKAEEVARAIQVAGESPAWAIFMNYWPIVLIAGGGVVTWMLMSQVKRARTRDAQTGANLRR